MNSSSKSILKEDLDDRWRAMFGGLEISNPQPAATRFYGAVPDQASLHGILETYPRLEP
jgi:hypothetical protein